MSADVGGLAKPVISAATKVAQAGKVKAVKTKLKIAVSVKKKV
jgi:hypothetical protein